MSSALYEISLANYAGSNNYSGVLVIDSVIARGYKVFAFGEFITTSSVILWMNAITIAEFAWEFVP